MRSLALIVVTVVFACGSGTKMGTPTQNQTTQAQFPTEPYRYSGPAIPAGASSGFATATDDIGNIPSGTSFGMQAARVDVFGSDLTARLHQVETLSGTYKSPTEIELVLDGQVYPLTYDPVSDEFTSTSPLYDGTLTLAVFTEQQSQYSALASVTKAENLPNYSSANLYFATLGYTTDPNQLPARASYAGDARLNVFPENGQSDTATGTVAFTADFVNSDISGVMSIFDPAGDTSGPIDLQDVTLNLTRPFISMTGADIIDPFSGGGGVITGNSFETRLSLPASDWQKVGFTHAPNINLLGTFFGPNGEVATGVGVGNGWTTGGANDAQVIILTTINATQN